MFRFSAFQQTLISATTGDVIELDEFNAFWKILRVILFIYLNNLEQLSFLVLTFNPISASIKNRFDISSLLLKSLEH